MVTILIQRLVKRDLRVFLALLFLVLAGYGVMLNSPFKSMDDDFSIVRNQDIRSFANIPGLFRTSYFKADSDYYRPLVYVTYTVEYHFYQLKHFFYNLDNVLLHVLNAMLVFWLALLVLRERPQAFLAAVLFAIHPLHWEAVASVSGRAILLCGFFVLSAFICFIRYLKDGGGVMLLLSVLYYALGLLSKESAIVFVVVAALYVRLVEKELYTPGRFWIWFVSVIGVAATYMIIRSSVVANALFPWTSLREAFFGVVSAMGGVLTYMRLFFLPVDLHFDRAQWVYRSFSEPWFWMILIAWAGLVTFTFLFRRKWTALGVFLVAWFFIELFPVLQLVTTIGVYPGAISLAEHFVYVASVPVFILFARAGFNWQARGYFSSWSFRILGAGMTLFLFLTLVQQNIYASNEYMLLSQSLAREPKNARLHSSLGMVYVKTGDFARAYEQFSRAVEIEPPNLKYRIAAARALFDKGDTLGAAREYEKIPVGKDNDPAVMAARTVVYEKLVEQYTARVKASPGNKEYYFALGVFYSKLSRYSEALTAFETTWKLDRTRFDALFNMAVTAELLGDQPRARDAYAELVKRAAADNKFRKLAEAKLAVR